MTSTRNPAWYLNVMPDGHTPTPPANTEGEEEGKEGRKEGGMGRREGKREGEKEGRGEGKKRRAKKDKKINGTIWIKNVKKTKETPEV